MMRPTAAVGPDLETDPLVIEPYFGELEDDLDGEGEEDAGEEAMDESGPHDVIIAPDPTHKTGHSGGSPYCMSVPDAAIDAPLDGEENYGTFVEYLRLSFRWGGFPGLRVAKQPPREELAFLTEGLSPL